MEKYKQKKKLQIIGILLSALLVLFILFSGFFQTNSQKKDTFIGDTDALGLEDYSFLEYSMYDVGQVTFSEDVTVNVFIADTVSLRTKGLSEKNSLPDGYGMLFIFPKEDMYSFWMKDMNFAIDMVWINEEGTVVHIESNVSPETYPNLFVSIQPALYVLEVNAGYVRELGLTVGTEVEIEL